MGWTNPEAPYNPNETDFDLDLFEFNTQVITDANPWMAQYPNVVTELARSGLSPLELQREANNMFYHTQANLMFESLPTLSKEQQRVVYNSLNESQKQLLNSAGYIPPAGHQPDWVEKTLSGFGNFVTFPLRATLGNLTRLPYVGGGFKWGLEGLAWIGDQPARLYRTQAQMEPWERGVMAVSAVAAVASKNRFGRANNAFGRFLTNTDTAARQLGRPGVIGSNFLVGGTGAFVGGAATNFIPNGTDFFDAWKRAGNGETLFREEAFEQLDEVTQDGQLQNLARRVANYLDETDLQGRGRTLAEKLALEVAGQPDAHKDDVYNNAASLFVANDLVDASDPNFQLFQQALFTLLADERFREMVNILQRNKISLGRDIARGAGLQPGSAMFSFVSGMSDGAAAFYLDPFLGAAPYVRTGRFATLSTTADVGTSVRGGYGWMWRKRPDKVFDTALDKRIWLSRNNIRGLRQVDEDIVAALNANNVMLMPTAYRPSFFDMRQHFQSRHKMTPTGAVKGKITVEELYEYFETADAVFQLNRGAGLRRGIPHQSIFDARRAPGNRGAFRDSLRNFRGTLSDAQDRVRLKQLAAEYGIDTDWILIDDITGDVVLETTEDIAQRSITAHALNKVNAGVNAITRTRAHLGSFIDGISTMGQTRSFVDLNDVESIAQLINGMGAIARIPVRQREKFIAQIVAHTTVGGRRAAVRSFYNTVFEVTGIKYRPKGQQFVDEFIEKAFQGFGYTGNEIVVNSKLDEVVTRAGTDLSHQSTKLAVPNMKELSRVVRDDMYMNTLMGITRDGTVLDAGMSRIWKPAVLLRFSFIPRAFGEEGLAWITRGTEFTIMQNIGARQVAKYELYKTVRQKLIDGKQLYQLTPAERAVVNKRLMRHMYPEMERLITQNGANINVNRNILGKTFGAGEHLLLNQYESFIRWLSRYQGIPQLKKALTALDASHPNLSVLLAGRKGSWTRAGATGLDNDILVSAQNYVNRHARVMSESLSARSHNNWNTDLGNVDETYIFDYKKGQGKKPIAVAAVGGVRQKVSQADPLYKRGYWEDAASKFDHPAKGGLYAREFPRRPPIEDPNWDNAKMKTFVELIERFTAFGNDEGRYMAEIMTHLAMFENDMWQIMTDTLLREAKGPGLPIGKAMEAATASGSFDIDAFLNALVVDKLPDKKLYTDPTRATRLNDVDVERIKEVWDWLESTGADVRGYAKGVAGNVRFELSDSRIRSSMFDAGTETAVGNRVYMGTTPVKNNWKTEIDADGNLIITPVPQNQWNNESVISMSTDSQQALRYSLDSWHDTDNPFKGVVFEFDGDYLAGLTGQTFDDILANPLSYFDLARGTDAFASTTQAKLLFNSNNSPSSWSTEIAFMPKTEFMSAVDNPLFNELTPVWKEFDWIFESTSNIVPQEFRDLAWTIRDELENWNRFDPSLSFTEWAGRVDNYERVATLVENLAESARAIDETQIRLRINNIRDDGIQRLEVNPDIIRIANELNAFPSVVARDIMTTMTDGYVPMLNFRLNALRNVTSPSDLEFITLGLVEDIVSVFGGETFGRANRGMQPEQVFSYWLRDRASKSKLNFYNDWETFIRSEYLEPTLTIPAGKWRTLDEQEARGLLDEALTDGADPVYGPGWSQRADQLLHRETFKDISLEQTTNRLIDLRNQYRVVDEQFDIALETFTNGIDDDLAALQLSPDIINEFTGGKGLAVIGPDNVPVLSISQLAWDDLFTSPAAFRRELMSPDEIAAARLSNDPALLADAAYHDVKTIIEDWYNNQLDTLFNSTSSDRQRLADIIISDQTSWGRAQNLTGLGTSFEETFVVMRNFFDTTQNVKNADNILDAQLVLTGATRKLQDEIAQDETFATAANDLFKGIAGSPMRNASRGRTMNVGEALLLDSFYSGTIHQNYMAHTAWEYGNYQDAYLQQLNESVQKTGQGSLPRANRGLFGNNELLQNHLKREYNTRVYRPEYANELASTEFSVASAGKTVAQPVPDGMVRYFMPELRDTNKIVREIENMKGTLIDVNTTVVDEAGQLYVTLEVIEELNSRLVRSQGSNNPRFRSILRLPIEQREKLLQPFLEASLEFGAGSVNQVLRQMGTTDPLLADWVTHTLNDVPPNIAGAQRGMYQVDIPASVAKSKGVPEWGQPYEGASSRYNIWNMSNDAGFKIDYVNGDVLADGTVGISQRDAIRNWTDGSIDSDMHLFAKGSREQYIVRGEVYRVNTSTGEFELVPAGTNIDSITRQLFDKDGNRLDFNDRNYFEITGSQMEGINHALTGPMILDYYERQAGMARVIPTASVDFDTNQILPDADFVPVRHSRVSHVDAIEKRDRPNLVIGREYTPVKRGNAFDRITNSFFEDIVGPVLDATVRNPMAFAAYHTSRLAGLRSMNSLISENTSRALNDVVTVLRNELNKRGSYKFDNLIADYAKHMNTDAAQAMAVYQIYSQLTSRDVWEYWREGIMSLDELKYAVQHRFFIDSPNGPQEISWLDARTVKHTAIPFHPSELVDVLTEEAANAIGTVQKHSEHLDLLAVQNATQNVIPFIDSAEYRSVFSQRASNMLPFWYAEENFIKRWLRGAQSGMFGIDQLVKAQYAIQGLLTTGIVYEDNGTYYFNWPGTPIVNDLLNRLFGSPGLGTTVRSPVESILPGINPEAGRPTLGPLGTVPIQGFTFVLGEIAPSLRDETTQFRRHIMGDIGSIQSWYQQLIPTTLRRSWDTFMAMFAEDDATTNNMSSIVTASINLEAGGHGLDPDSTPEEQQTFWDRARAHARVMTLSKLLWGFIIPGSPQLMDAQQNPMSVAGITGIGLENPASLVKGEYLRYIQTWGADEGTRRFLIDFPDSNLNYIVNPEAYMASKTQTVSGAPLAPNEENLQWTLENIEYIKSNPMAMLWLAPNKSYEGEWNQYAWADQFSSDLRIMKTPDEIQASIQFQKAAPAYFEAQEAYEQRRANAGDNKNLIDLIDADWSIQRDFYLKTHPVFAAQLQNSEGRLIRQQTINEFRIVLYDPEAPASPFTPAVRQLFEMWNEYTVVQGQLSLNRTTASREVQEKNKEKMQAAVDAWLLRNPELQSLWLSVFKPETDL